MEQLNASQDSSLANIRTVVTQTSKEWFYNIFYQIRKPVSRETKENSLNYQAQKNLQVMCVFNSRFTCTLKYLALATSI